MSSFASLIALFLLCFYPLNFFLASAAVCNENCNVNNCSPPGDCYAGIVKDKCNCCYVCGQLEGQRCFNRTLKELPRAHQRFASCGEQLECRLRDDLADGDEPEAICVCNSQEPLCASDGRTYENVCRLTEARYRQRDGLIAVARGPCKIAPKIMNPPGHMRNGSGINLAFSCEASGYPIPTIEWRFVAARRVRRDTFSDQNKEPEVQYERETVTSLKSLPADDPHIAVQSRGGPSPYAITSWLQILHTQLSDTGRYICVASNSQGEQSAYGSLLIEESAHESGNELQRRKRTGNHN